MTEEIKEEIKSERKENCCLCKCEFFQRTLAVTIGSFIGMFFAMNLFFALHKPPMMHFKHKFNHHINIEKQNFKQANLNQDFHKFKPGDFNHIPNKKPEGFND